MKRKQNALRPQTCKRVVHILPQRTAQPSAPEQATTSERLAVRTGVKAGLLTALLLQQQVPPPNP